MSENPAVLAGVFNNNVVRLLKTGSPDAVKSLVTFGCRPEMSLDLVEEASERHTFWGWSHAAPKADGAAAWWYWVERFVTGMTAHAAQKHLAWALDEAMDVGFAHEQVDPFLCTWRNLLAHALKKTTPGWTRDIMMGRFLDRLGQETDKAEPFLVAFHQAGLIGPTDCDLAARKRCRQDPLERAIAQGESGLVEALLAVGSGDRLASGESGLGLAWSQLPQLPRPAKGAPSATIVRVAQTVAVLLERGADWSARTGAGPTVQEQTAQERASFTHPSLGRLASAIDARSLDHELARTTSRSTVRRRL